MSITLAEARVFCAPFVGSGLAPTNPKVVSAIDEAITRLLPKLPAKGSMARLRFFVNNGTITMPREVETLKRVNVDATPSNIFSRWYEFLNFGPGTMDDNQTSAQNFIDLGDGYCTHSDPHTALKILVTADETEVDKSIRILGNDESGREVRTNGIPGEEVLINKLMPAYSNSKFSCITSVMKPVTKGYVYLSAYDPSPLRRYDLATYHPDETSPCYRRYRVTAVCQCGSRLTNCALCALRTTCAAYTNNQTDENSTVSPITVTALCKLRQIPLKHDSDVLLIQNLPAIKSMLQAIRYYDATDAKNGLIYEGLAEKALAEQLKDTEPQTNQLDFEMCMPGVGTIGVM
jgi:hypothetical protein